MYQIKSDAAQIKERIISNINLRGPALPIQIAKATSQSTLFASAFLSELFEEQRLKMSNLKVGSSSLYYIKGQEPLLENFIQHLNQKEREAFNLLKSKKILEDDKQEPAIRVALRAIKDFAIPSRITINNEEKNVWKYHLLSEEDLLSIINPKPKEEPKQEIKEETPQKTIEKDNQIQEEIKIEKPKEIASSVEQETPSITNALQKDKSKIKQKAPKESDLKFSEKIQAHLRSKNFSILEIIQEKKKEYVAKVSLNSPWEQELYLVYKDKKKITEEELIIALQRAQEQRMPALILSPGEVDKKALPYLNNWKNLIKFEKLKL